MTLGLRPADGLSTTLDIVRLAGSVGLCTTLWCGTALAQTASELTPDSFEPSLQRLDGEVRFTGQAGTEAPPGAQDIGITLSGVRLDGAFEEMSAANAAYQTRLTRGQIPVSELFEATADLEAAYADAGYVLARIVLPQQALRDGGVLRVTVVDGVVEDVETDALPDEVRGRVETLTDPLIGQSRLTLSQLERQLLLAGDTPGLGLDSALAAGERQSGTIIALDSQFQPVTGFVGLDTYVPEDLNDFALNGGVEVNSALGLGEVFYGRFAGALPDLFSDDPLYRTLAAGILVPVGTSGLSFNLEFTTSETTPQDQLVDTNSSFDRWSLRAAYPVLRGRQANLNLRAILDVQDDEQDQLAGGGRTPVYEDAITALRFGVDGSYRTAGDALFRGGVMLSLGQDWFDARSAEDAAGGTPLSRAGADSDFRALAANFSYDRRLGDQVGFSLLGTAQTSFGDPLMISEQFSIAGQGAISAYDSGALSGDSGWMLRAELSSAREMQLGDMPLAISPYVFAATGSVTIEAPTAVEVGTETARALGLGVNLFAQGESRFRALSAQLEFAAGDRSDGSDSSMLGFTLSHRF